MSLGEGLLPQTLLWQLGRIRLSGSSFTNEHLGARGRPPRRAGTEELKLGLPGKQGYVQDPPFQSHLRTGFTSGPWGNHSSRRLGLRSGVGLQVTSSESARDPGRPQYAFHCPNSPRLCGPSPPAPATRCKSTHPSHGSIVGSDPSQTQQRRPQCPVAEPSWAPDLRQARLPEKQFECQKHPGEDGHCQPPI